MTIYIIVLHSTETAESITMLKYRNMLETVLEPGENFAKEANLCGCFLRFQIDDGQFMQLLDFCV